MLTLLWIAALLVTVLVLAYVNASGVAFTVAFGVALLAAWSANIKTVLQITRTATLSA